MLQSRHLRTELSDDSRLADRTLLLVLDMQPSTLGNVLEVYLSGPLRPEQFLRLSLSVHRSYVLGIH